MKLLKTHFLKLNSFLCLFLILFGTDSYATRPTNREPGLNTEQQMLADSARRNREEAERERRAHVAEMDRLRKQNWKGCKISLAVGAVLGLALMTTGIILETMSNHQDSNGPQPSNNTVGCFSLTTNNCGKCIDPIQGSVRCIANDTAAVAQVKNQIGQQLDPICKSNSNFTFALDEQPCLSDPSSKCFNDQFAAQIAFLNQACRVIPSAMNHKSIKRLMKYKRAPRGFQQTHR